MNIPFTTRKTAHSVMAPLFKIIADLEAVKDEQEGIVERETIAINEARARLQQATAEAVTAQNFITKVKALTE